MKNNGTSGIGICGALGIVFIVLKLLGVISWSWWWVLAPIWMPTAIGVALLLICATIRAIIKANDKKYSKKYIVHNRKDGEDNGRT